MQTKVSFVTPGWVERKVSDPEGLRSGGYQGRQTLQPTAHFKTLIELGCHKLPKGFSNPNQRCWEGFEIASTAKKRSSLN
ncbi:hypothetical protein A3H19_00475 [Candidatus Woesebacteria bacterium RIFCSPLOWO2_12_FULL_39_9]|nr:MAG: hypothetical protein A3H19_00475 [Candidatus Woesebacteria bacterium RIFCSPLOWO2_12_FULL_39_9]